MRELIRMRSEGTLSEENDKTYQGRTGILLSRDEGALLWVIEYLLSWEDREYT